MQLIVAEKPSVARDIARVLGVRGGGRGALEGAGRVITWCVGHLADAARCRSEADWLGGVNAPRAVPVRHRSGPGSTLYSIGRVQTPTLALVVEREKAIRAFVPRDYWELRARLTRPGGSGEAFTA